MENRAGSSAYLSQPVCSDYLILDELLFGSAAAAGPASFSMPSQEESVWGSSLIGLKHNLLGERFKLPWWVPTSVWQGSLLGKSGLCFLWVSMVLRGSVSGFPMVVVVMAVQVVMVVAVVTQPWDFGRMETGWGRHLVQGDWLPAVMDGGTLPTTEANTWKKKKNKQGVKARRLRLTCRVSQGQWVLGHHPRIPCQGPPW